MKTLKRLLRPFSGLKEWTSSLPERLFILDEWQNNEDRHFKDPYEDMDYLHDQEMERLVRAINEAKNNTDVRYQ